MPGASTPGRNPRLTDPFRAQLASALEPQYSIERELTGGGMSRVFVAVERALNRTVVIKVLKPELAADVNRERFRREIMLVAQLHHPHVVPVLTAGERGDLLWYTMPFVEGASLRDEIRDGRKFAAREVVRVLRDVLDALDYAHARGVVHRDIKPGNILRHRSHSLVTDFGVAKAISAAMPQSGTTSTGMAIGTPSYMAPEQLAADPAADHRVDLYAVGLLGYELLAGTQPFAATSPQETMAAQLTRMPRPLAEIRPDCPVALTSLITWLLAKNPNDRPASAAEALAALDALDPSGEHTPSGAFPPQRIERKRWLQVAGLGVVLVGAYLFQQHGRRAEAMRVDSARRADSVRVADSTRRVDSVRADSVRLAQARADSLSRARALAQQRAAAAAAARAPSRRFTPARRVAVLPARLATPSRTDLTATARALTDSLRAQFTRAGYELATDGELVQLLSQQQPAHRRTAQAMGLGAIATTDLIVRGTELRAQTLVWDIWRNVPLATSQTSDLDSPGEVLDVARDATRALDRVSWRRVGDPRRFIVFAFDNLTGMDSLDRHAEAVTRALTAGAASAANMIAVTDAAAIATRDVLERREVALRAGAGALVAGSVLRHRGDSLRVRFAVRDMSDDVNHPTVETVILRNASADALRPVIAQLVEMLGRVNWGPRQQR